VEMCFHCGCNLCGSLISAYCREIPSTVNPKEPMPPARVVARFVPFNRRRHPSAFTFNVSSSFHYDAARSGEFAVKVTLIGRRQTNTHRAELMTRRAGDALELHQPAAAATPRTATAPLRRPRHRTPRDDDPPPRI